MPKTYFCTECKRNHRHGKIYKEHLKYKQKEGKKYDTIKVQKIGFTLRFVAKRQLNNLINQMLWNPSRKGIYIRKINELIDYERRMLGNKRNTSQI